MREDSDDEEFVYPGASLDPPEEAEFVYPGTPDHPPIAEMKPQSLSVAASPIPTKNPPSPADLEALHAAAVSGELKRVQNVFRNVIQSGDIESFALANDASPRTGLTALHAASSRGYLNIVKWCTCFTTRACPSLDLYGTQWWKNVELCLILRTGKARLVCEARYLSTPYVALTLRDRRHCTKLRCMDISPLSHICYQTEQMFKRKMRTDGLRCTTPAPR